MLQTLPGHSLEPFGLTMDTAIASREASRPIGGRIAFFVANWEKLSSYPWIRETVCGHRLELRATPRQPYRPKEIVISPEKTEIIAKEINDLMAKRAIMLCGDNGEGIRQPPLPSPKSRRLLEASHQPQRPQCLCCHNALQEGIGTISEDHNPEGRLAPQVGLEGHLPLSTHRPSLPEVPQILLGRAPMAVQNIAIWLQQCPPDIHQPDEAGSGYSEETWNPPHTADGSQQGGSQGESGSSDGIALLPGLPHQHEEECVHTGQDNRVPGVQPGLHLLEDQLATRQAHRDKEVGRLPAPPTVNISSASGTPTGDCGGSPPSNLPSPSIFQFPGEGPAESNQERQGLRLGSKTGQPHGSGPPMVARLGSQLQWEASADPPVGHSNRVGCIQERLGSLLTRSVHRRTVDNRREEMPYQLSGTPRILSSTEDVCRQPAQLRSPLVAGQHDCDSIHQQDGWHSLQLPGRLGVGQLWHMW